MDYKECRDFFTRVLLFAKKERAEISLVGGFLRDLFIFDDFYSNDIDFITTSNVDKLAKNFADDFKGEVLLFSQFLTSKVRNLKTFKNVYEVDFARYREERYLKSGDFPKVKAVSDIKEDLKRRDFTINTLVIPLEDFIKTFDDSIENIDHMRLRKHVKNYLFALEDIDKKIIRVLHKKSFHDDPTRIFRAFRYKARISGSFDKETFKLILEALSSGVLNNISKNRIKKEIEKIKKERDFEKILNDLEEIGIKTDIE
ncbi:MAG: hypothetical protein ACOX3T_04540 [Bdellovibrionota bacterium]